MAKTFDELVAGANKIRTNELPESNTHGLVGEQILHMVNKQIETDKKVDENKNTADDNLKMVKENVLDILQAQEVSFAKKAEAEFAKNKDYVDGKSIEIAPASVTPESLSESTKQLIGSGGNVTNLADDEDLTAEGGVLKLKDKAFAPINFSGLGRKRLRKNVSVDTGGKNVLTQAMINQLNTVYIIEYDYDLNGATITIPADCTLQFEGGSLRNGVLVGNNTIIKNVNNDIIFTDTYFNSNSPTYNFICNNKFICKSITTRWFGLIPNSEDNQQLKFEQLSTLICSCENVVLNVETGIYKFGRQDGVNQRMYNTFLASLAPFIGHSLLKVTGSVTKSFILNGNGSKFEDIYPHKTGWFNEDGTPDLTGQTGGYTLKKFAYPGTGIIIKNVSSLQYVKIDGVDINLNYRKHEYGGSIAPTLSSECIGIFLKDNIGDVYVSNCKLHGSPTDGSMIWYQNYAELNNVECYDNVRSGFSAESGKNYSLYSSRFFNNGYELPVHEKFNHERPWTNVNFEIMATTDHTINDVVIDGCYFGDCGQDAYSLSVMRPGTANVGTYINNLYLTNCTFERTKSVKTALNVNGVNRASVSNITMINSQYTTPSALYGSNVNGIKIMAQKWEGYNEITSSYKLASFQSTVNSTVSDITIYLLDYFSVGDFNVATKTNPRVINNITVHVLEPLHFLASAVLGLGRIPSNTGTLRIIDHVSDADLVDKDKPVFVNIEAAREVIYIKNIGTVKSIRLPNMVYKTDAKIVNEEYHTNPRVSKLMMYDGNYSTPGSIAFSCMRNSTLDFESLPNKSLSYNPETDSNCKFYTWNAATSKFDVFFGMPRRLKQWAFNTKSDFDKFCTDNTIATLIKGERIIIANQTAFATGVGVNIVDPNGFVFNDKKGTTSQRPTLTASDEGIEYYDSTLKKKILWNGTAWVNLDGTALI